MALKEIRVGGKIFEISYEIVGNGNKDIIFLHGWGANKEIMKVFAPYFKEFRQIYIDMPGFGKSSNKYVLTTKDYAKIIDEFLKNINVKKNIIVGHSFGGKVATLLKPDLLILLASAGIVLPKPLSIRAKIKLYKFLKKFGGSKFRKFFVSKDVKEMSENMYETFKNVVDENFEEIFKSYNGDVIVFGGNKDTAVPFIAVKKQGELLKSKPIILNGDHYFFFKNPQNIQIIREKIIERLK